MIGARSSILAAVLLCLLPTCQPALPADPAQVEVSQGRLRGVVRDGVVRFHGVPYAAPPTGDRRWAAPAAAVAWSETRDATRPRPPCPQIGERTQTPVGIEDCLYVNIVTPAAPAKPRPVLVWLHGGGLTAGSANDYDAARMARSGDAVVVTVESRLNVMGYLALPGLPGSATFGLADEQAALRWVRANIAAFGGDPARVTLFGESGGGIRTCAHLTAPGSAGLFDRAILQSGGCHTSPPTTVIPAGSFWAPVNEIARDGSAFAASLGCTGAAARQLACLRAVPLVRLVKAGALRFGRAGYGGRVLPQRPDIALDGGAFARVPVIAGFNRDEGRAFVGLLRLLGSPMSEATYAGNLRGSFGPAATEIAARYPVERFAAENAAEAPALAWGAVITDRMFACPALRDLRAIARHAPAWGYRFDDPRGIGLVPFGPGFPSGASHSGELPLLFDLTTGDPRDIATGKPLGFSPAQQALARNMIARWTRFAATGNSRWPRFAPDGTLLRLAPDRTAPLANTRAAHQCDLWDRLSAQPVAAAPHVP